MQTRTLRRRLVGLAVAAAAVPSALLPLTASAASADAAAAAAAPSFTKVQGAAANAAGLTRTVDAYRKLLGDPDNGSTPGSQPGGRREINWDGTPDARSAPNLLPKDFFNTVVPRGAVFGSKAGNRFQVSADKDNPTKTAVRFGNINKQYPNQFATFSPEKLFTPLGTNVFSIRFQVPGSTRPATVKGFGAVFTDVDKADSTKIELYDKKGKRLWGQYVPKGPKAAKSLSFLGVKTSADIAEVRVTSGNVPLSKTNNDGGKKDAVVMDDFLYGEPRPMS